MNSIKWVYLKNYTDSGNLQFSVGFYDPQGVWNEESEWNSSYEAIARIYALVGETPPRQTNEGA